MGRRIITSLPDDFKSDGRDDADSRRNTGLVDAGQFFKYQLSYFKQKLYYWEEFNKMLLKSDKLICRQTAGDTYFILTPGRPIYLNLTGGNPDLYLCVEWSRTQVVELPTLGAAADDLLVCDRYLQRVYADKMGKLRWYTPNYPWTSGAESSIVLWYRSVAPYSVRYLYDRDAPMWQTVIDENVGGPKALDLPTPEGIGEASITMPAGYIGVKARGSLYIVPEGYVYNEKLQASSKLSIDNFIICNRTMNAGEKENLEIAGLVAPMIPTIGVSQMSPGRSQKPEKPPAAAYHLISGADPAKPGEPDYTPGSFNMANTGSMSQAVTAAGNIYEKMIGLNMYAFPAIKAMGLHTKQVLSHQQYIDMAARAGFVTYAHLDGTGINHSIGYTPEKAARVLYPEDWKEMIQACVDSGNLPDNLAPAGFEKVGVAPVSSRDRLQSTGLDRYVFQDRIPHR